MKVGQRAFTERVLIGSESNITYAFYVDLEKFVSLWL